MLDLNIPLNRDIVGLIDMGWSNSEISNELETSKEVVEGVVAEYFNDIHQDYLETLEEREVETITFPEDPNAENLAWPEGDY